MKKQIHACPRNCVSTCSIISEVKHNRLEHITGNPNDPYTRGKLCQKGYSYLERNELDNRLKYPYYQERKGSGNFKKVSWEKAFELITEKLIEIYDLDGDFKRVSYLKGTGNIGIHHHVVTEFFSKLQGAKKLSFSYPLEKSFEILSDSGWPTRSPHPIFLKNSGLIIIWGMNPAASHIHLIPLIIDEKQKGTKIVVIDPLYSQTAELADLFIQIKPATDGLLANLLSKRLVNLDSYDHNFIKEETKDFPIFAEQLAEMEHEDLLKNCGISQEAFNKLVELLNNEKTAAYLIGSGLLKYSKGQQSLRAIQALAAIRGDLNKANGGLFFSHQKEALFQNELLEPSIDNKNKHLLLSSSEDFTKTNKTNLNEMIWISNSNPLVQAPNIDLLENLLEQASFVVTVDHFLTPTTKMANLVLPTTTFFEELDILVSDWYGKMVLNEPALPGFYESKSEWEIMTEVAKRLKGQDKDISSFIIDNSEEAYLNRQFTEMVAEKYYVQSVKDLRNKRNISTAIPSKNKKLSPEDKYQFLAKWAKYEGLAELPVFLNSKKGDDKYPFRLITPQHPYAFNSQFSFLHLTVEREAHILLSRDLAKKLSISDGEVIEVYNDKGALVVRAKLNTLLPADLVVMFNYWDENSKIKVNTLITIDEMNKDRDFYQASNAFFDTFVNVKKL